MGEGVKMFCPIHSFDVSFREAKRIQSELRNLVEIRDTVAHIEKIDLVGGVDVAFITSSLVPSIKLDGDTESFIADSPEQLSRIRDIRKTNSIALAVAVTLDTQSNRVVETACAAAPVFFPYVPGFLSFREGPAVLRAVGGLSVLPKVMIYDGCGIAHPRGLGLASHIGLLTGIPSVGCAKSLLCGSCEKPGPTKGERTAIRYKDCIVGTCLRTRDNVRPVYVSPGNGVGIDSAREIVLSLALKYRLPEPTRLAHNLVTEYKKNLIIEQK